MKSLAIRTVFLGLLFFPAFPASAQEKPSKEEPPAVRPRPEGPQIKVQVVFVEFDGDKKIKSLPYTLLVRVGLPNDHDWSKIRMGSRVPIANNAEKTSFQYMDVGMNIDCYAVQAGDGSYRVTLNLERSWVETELSAKGDTLDVLNKPNTRQFRSESTVTFREGQTLETDSATDPVTGKVIRLEVTVNTLK